MRPCEVCGGALPEGARRTRRFCSNRCKNRAHAPLRAAWQAANPDKTREYGRRYRERNPDAVAATMRRYYAKNPEVFAAMRHRRRAALSADRRIVTTRDWQRLCARYDNRCAYCAAEAPLTRDHIIPLIRGGRHAIGNLIPACLQCNGSKSSHLLVEWRLARI